MILKSASALPKIGASPRPADLFFEEQAPVWSDRYASRTYQQRRNLVLSIVRRELSKRGKVPSDFAALDFGCGGGVFVEDLSRVGISVTGVDRSPAMVEVARSRTGRSCTVELEWLRQDFEGAYRRRAYDLILGLSVLEFTDNPEKLIAHLSSLLNFGGLLILTVPNQNSYLRSLERFGFEHPAFTRWIPGLTRLAQPDCYLHYQKRQFTAEALVKSAKKLGLVVEDLRFHIAPKLFGSMERLECVGMMLILTFRKSD